MVKYANITEVLLKVFYFTQQRPKDNPKVSRIIASIFILSAILYIGLTSVILWHINGDVDLLARTIEAMTTWCQMFIKACPIYFYRDRYMYLYEKHLTFWKPENFPLSVQNDAEGTYKITYYLIHIYSCLVFGTCFLFYLQPIYKPDELLIVCWVPPNVPYAFEVLLISQYAYAFIFAGFVVGIDMLYVVYVTHLIVQLKIINYTIQRLDVTDKDYFANFRKLIEYHKELLIYTEELVKFWSIPLLGQYGLSIYLSCMEVYLLMANIGNYGRMILSIGYSTCLYCQFALYCFPATYFITEAEKLAEAIYASNWYEGSMELQKNVGFVIMRAQKQFHFYAGGLAEINCEAFTVVFKASMSFLTVMRQMKEEAE